VIAGVPLVHGLLVAGGLFAIGLVGVLVRRNLLFQLLSIELMLNAAAMAFVFAGAHWGEADGQVMFIFILVMAAAEVAVGLALLLRIARLTPDLDGDAVSTMRG
jgi:NADH-quinone oxidoreductase subunit K